MKISIPQVDLGRAGVQQVSVGELKLGPVHVGQLSLNRVKVHAASGVAQLRNVGVVLTMQYALDWRVGVVIDVPDPFPDLNFSEKGTMNLGAMTLGIGFGHLTLPGLSDLSLDIASLPVADLSAVVGALKNLNLGAALAEQIQARGLQAPGQGFQLGGMALGGIGVQGVGVPDATLAGATIGRVSGGAVPIAGLTIPDLALPSVKLPRLSCQDVGASSNAVVTKLPTADVGLLQATLKVTTTAALHVEELRIDGLRATASIGEIALQDVALPWEVLGLTLSQLGIENISVPNLGVN